MGSYLKAVFKKIDAAEADIVPVLVVAGECDNNRHREEMYGSIKSLGLTLVNLLVVCFKESDMPWPVPLFPVVYYFEPGGRVPMFYTQRGTRIDLLERDVVKARLMVDEGLTFDEATFTSDERAAHFEMKAEYDRDMRSEYPPLTKMILSLGREAFRAARAAGDGQKVRASAETVHERYSLCMACEHFDAKAGRCRECGCHMKVKVNLETTECPIGKW